MTIDGAPGRRPSIAIAKNYPGLQNTVCGWIKSRAAEGPSVKPT